MRQGWMVQDRGTAPRSAEEAIVPPVKNQMTTSPLVLLRQRMSLWRSPLNQPMPWIVQVLGTTPRSVEEVIVPPLVGNRHRSVNAQSELPIVQHGNASRNTERMIRAMFENVDEQGAGREGQCNCEESQEFEREDHDVSGNRVLRAIHDKSARGPWIILCQYF